MAFAILLIPQAGASATTTGLPATLEPKVQAAFADIAKAKTALNGGNSKMSESWLSKAEGQLKFVLDAAPGSGGLVGKIQGQPATKQSGSGQDTSGFSQAEAQAARLDPSLASRPGMSAPGDQTADAGANVASSGPNSAEATPPPRTVLSRLADVYQKVTLAKALLKSGDKSKAKGLLDQIPASPLDLLKTAGGL